MIFYFTATGNSLQASELVAAQLNDELISIPAAIAENRFIYNVKEGESVGFIFPVYFYGIPTILTEFVSKLELQGEKDPYLFLILNCGGNTGIAGRMFGKRLKSRGYRLSAVHSVVMVDNYVLMYPVITREKQEEVLDLAEQQLKEICNKVRNREKGDFDELRGRAAGLLTKVAYPLYAYGRKTKKFYTDEKCTRCGLCERICPSHAIKVTKEGPVWQRDRCIHCLGCIHRCPTSAIQYGKSTVNRGRYVNPRVKL